jgi:hypothetical protein
MTDLDQRSSQWTPDWRVVSSDGRTILFFLCFRFDFVLVESSIDHTEHQSKIKDGDRRRKKENVSKVNNSHVVFEHGVSIGLSSDLSSIPESFGRKHFSRKYSF